MKAVVLAGGEGTRLAPYNTIFPKPLVPLGDRPILDIVIHQLAHYGFGDITLSVGHLAELIEAYFHNGSPRHCEAKISFVREETPQGTVGSLGLVDGLDETFLVMNGDILTTLDYAELMAFHKKQGGLLTIAMHRRAVNLDLGVMEVDDTFALQSFLEKPTMNYNVSMGVYVYEPEVLDYITPGERLDFPDVVWRMLREKKRVVCFPFDGYWLDLGSHTDYEQAQNDFAEKKHLLIPGGESLETAMSKDKRDCLPVGGRGRLIKQEVKNS